MHGPVAKSGKRACFKFTCPRGRAGSSPAGATKHPSIRRVGRLIKTYGPYSGQRGRRHVIHVDTATKARKTQSYARYLMEKHLGRPLAANEHVDHINGDCTDDRLENLQILSPGENNRKAIKQLGRETKYFRFICPQCGIEASKELRYYRSNQLRQGKAGPYCSKSCAGKAHR